MACPGCALRRAPRRRWPAAHLFLGIGLVLLLPGLEATSGLASTDDTKSTVFSTSLWTSAELQTSPTSSGHSPNAVQSSGNAVFNTVKQTTASIILDGMNISDVSQVSAQHDKTNTVQTSPSPVSSVTSTSQAVDEATTVSVPSSASSYGMSTEASSEGAAAARSSVPTSSVPNMKTASHVTGSKATQTVTTLTNNTLSSVTHIRRTTSQLTSDSKKTSAIQTPDTSVVHTTLVNSTIASTTLSTPHLTTMTSAVQKPTHFVTTAHTPTTTKTRSTASTNSTHPEMTKTSTTYQLTISAALTSIIASTKATTLPATNVKSTTTAVAKTTTPTSSECILTENIMVNTAFVVAPKLTVITLNLTQDISDGLKQALEGALTLITQVEIYKSSIDNSVADMSTVTVGYFVKILLQNVAHYYIPSAVVEALLAYGNASFTKDMNSHVPNLRYVLLVAQPRNSPDSRFQLKTQLQVVGSLENVHVCSFVQTMEQRLQKAFQYASTLSSATIRNSLEVQIVSTSLDKNVLTLLYAVRDNTGFLNGTVSSNVLNLLSAELVGFYLGYPPLVIAEALEYPVISTSDSTRAYWVYTVIQGVEDKLLTHQPFSRLMEQRLAQLFQMSSLQGRRFRRATTIGEYTVQMVGIDRVQGPKSMAELKYYALHNGVPVPGSTAAKQLSTIDSQTMALTLGYVVQVQAESVDNKPPSNMWIIAAVLAPIAVVTIIIIIITAVLCRKNKSDFKAESMANMPPRPKPVHGFDYAKKHLGHQGGEDDVLPVSQETVVPPLTITQEGEYIHDVSTGKTAKSSGTRKSQSPSENGSVMSNESGQPSSGGSTPQKTMTPQKAGKEEAKKRNVPLSDEEDGSSRYDNTAKMAADPFDTSSGSVQLVAVKPVGMPPSNPSSDRSQESAIINGEVNKALKQKSDIEHYRNKLRLKAKKKGYYDFPPVDGSKSLTERKRKMYEKKQKELDRVLDPDTDVSSPFAGPTNRQPSAKNATYRSRQSLNSPSPGETEMDLLVTRERPRRGIRNSGYDTEPEVIEETNVDRVKETRRYTKTRQAKGHSETSTLSSQPSIDEVRQQMHMLLEEAFSLASAGHAGTKRQPEAYSSAQQLPYSEVVTSAPGTMTRSRGGVQWVPTYGPETYQYSLPRPAYRFSQLPEMVMGSPPPPVPPRTGPVAVTSLRRSTSDIGSSKTRLPEPSGNEQAQHDAVAFAPVLRNPVPVAPLDHPTSNYSGDTVPAVFAIPANRTGFTGYFVPRPPAAYRNQAWVSYTGENELPGQWADSVPLPGYIEAYPRPHYPQNSPSRLPRQYNQPSNIHPSLEHSAVLSAAVSQQSLADTDTPDTSLTNLSTAALVKAIREEVAKLAKKQTDRFEFQV